MSLPKQHNAIKMCNVFSNLEKATILHFTYSTMSSEGEVSQQQREEELGPETVGAPVMGKVQVLTVLYSPSTTTAAAVTTTAKTDLSPTNQPSSTNKFCGNKGHYHTTE